MHLHHCRVFPAEFPSERSKETFSPETLIGHINVAKFRLDFLRQMLLDHNYANRPVVMPPFTQMLIVADTVSRVKNKSVKFWDVPCPWPSGLNRISIEKKKYYLYLMIQMRG